MSSGSTDFHSVVKNIAAGDERALEQLYQHFQHRVFNTVISYLQNQEDATEVTQDVFVEVFHSAAGFKGESSVSTWIYRIAVNKCLDRLRYRNRKKRFAFVTSLFSSTTGEVRFDKPDFFHPGVAAENKEKAAILFKAIDALPDQQRTAFLLAFVEDLPRQEVADVMKMNLKAVESLLQRAKGNLRGMLEDFYRQSKD